MRQFIRAGYLVDGTGGPVQQDVVLETKSGFIRSIRPAAAVESAVRDILDLSDSVILPGLVDAHVHLFMSGTDDPAIREQQLNADFETIRPVIARHLEQHRKWGVVAVRDGGDYGGHALRYCRENSGLPVLVRNAGKAWRCSGRYGKLIGRPPANGWTLSEEIAACSAGADHVKIVQSGINSLKVFGRETAPQFDPETLQKAVKTAHNLGLKVMAHCNGKLPVEIALKAGCDSVEHGFFMGTDNLKRMADSGTIWVPTAVTMKAFSRILAPGSPQADMAYRNFEHQLAQIAEAGILGVKIALGTDAGSLGVHHGAAVREELEIFMEAGYSLEKAVHCATENGATLLGLENPGRLEPGQQTFFIAVPGPLSGLTENLVPSQMRFVIPEENALSNLK